MLKRITTSLFCLFLIFVSIPFLGDTQFLCTSVYADSVPDGYSPCGFNDQVDAFRSYCNSRNLAIEGSGLDAVTSFTSDAYQGLLKKSGFDVNQLQNEIYKRTSDNLGAKWFFTSVGISAYNRMFAEFLQNNGLEVGDTVTDDTLYSGSKFTDNNGKTSLIWYVNGFKGQYNTGSDIISAKGSVYLDGSVLVNSYPNTGEYYYELPITHLNFGTNIKLGVNVRHTSSSYYVRTSSLSGAFAQGNYLKYDNTSTYGNIIIVRNIADGSLNVATISYTQEYNNTTNYTLKGYFPIKETSSNVGSNVTVNVTTTNNYNNSNNVINNNNYEGDTYITNEGDVINQVVPGGNDPGWNVGGGQGSYDDGQGNNYTINFPDFELPDLNIDWSIQGLGNKFPFSIPFDIVSLVTVLNAEPEAPRFQGTVNFGFTTWNYDINLQQFDSVAQVCRIAELLLLVFGLILITRSIIKG